MKKAALFAFICAAMTAAQTGTPATNWYSPSSSTFNISTADQLAGLAQLVNDGTTNFQGKTINLTTDIDLSAYNASNTAFNGGKGWIPIGHLVQMTDNSTFFMGTFDGGGHTVSKLYINNADLRHAGLFGYVSGGTIKNLGVTGVVTTDEQYAGLIAGYIGLGSAENCYTSGKVGGKRLVGGAVGYISSTGSVTNCYSTSDVNGQEAVGGVAGAIAIGGHLTNCYATGAVSGGTIAGGIAGRADGRNVITGNAALNVSVTGTGNNVGRVIGGLAPRESNINNAAFSGMNGNFTGVISASGTHGANITRNTIYNDGTIGGRFTDANVWTTANNKLPGLGGSAVEMPAHLIPSSYIISFNLNGGTGAVPDTIHVTPNNHADSNRKPDMTGFVRTGYTLADDNWYTDAAGTNAFVFGGTIVYDDMTLYPKWTLNTARYEPPHSGAGTSGSPYVITNAKQLAYVSVMVNEGTGNYGIAHYKLGSTQANVNNMKFDISDYGADYNDGKGWIPIGAAARPFMGVFGGGGYMITGLYINNDTLDNAGLFGYVTGTVERLGADGTVIGRDNAGGIAGRLDGGSVKYCYSAGAVAGRDNVGGVIGYVSNGYTENCAALNPSVKGGGSHIGRVVGHVNNTGDGGDNSASTLSNNVAFDGMLNGSDNTIWNNKGGDAIDGADTSALAIMQDPTIGNRYSPPIIPPEHIKLHKVSFGAAGGAITAVMDNETITSPYWIAKDKAVTFTAVPNDGNDILSDSWRVKIDGVPEDPNLHGDFSDNYHTYTLRPNPSGDVEVTVAFGGQLNGFFEIAFFGGSDGFVYTGETIDPRVIVVPVGGGGSLIEDADYSIVYDGDRINVGTLSITVTGKGTYNGTLMSEFHIVPKPFDNRVQITVAPGPHTYNGNEHEPEIIVKDTDRGVDLVSGVDYESTPAYTNNINAGISVGRVAVTGIGNYSGTAAAPFSIEKKEVTVTQGTYGITKVYDGTTDAAAATATAEFQTDGILDKDKADVKVLMASGSYSGSNVGNNYTVNITLKLSDDTNYRLTNAMLQINGAITPRDISVGEDVDVNIGGTYMYTGHPQQLPSDSVTVTVGGRKLVHGDHSDYTFAVTPANMTDAGDVDVTVTGRNNYTGERDARFTIAPKPLTNSMVTLSNVLDTYTTYNGTFHTPAITVKDGYAELTLGADYENVEYTNNKNAGDASVTVTGKGNYTGKAERTFTIMKKSVSVKRGTYGVTKVYDGTTSGGTGTGILDVTGILNGETAVTDAPGAYPNKNVGSAHSVTIQFALSDDTNYSLSPTSLTIQNAAITPRNISGAEVTVGGTYIYNGKPQTPAANDISVTLSGFGVLASGNEYVYDVSDSRTNAGVVTVVITGIMNFEGTATGSYTIAKKTPALSDVTYSVPTGHKYSGSPQGIGDVTIADTGYGTITILYNGNTALPVDTGTYVVTASISGGTNYTQAVLTLGNYNIGGTTSILTRDRTLPDRGADEDAAVIAPVSAVMFEFSAGPNPVRRSDGTVKFYVAGKFLADGRLTVYDATGNVVQRVNVNVNSRRIVGEWDMRDMKGRPVADGAYLVRGVVTTVDGKRERVSAVVGVR